MTTSEEFIEGESSRLITDSIHSGLLRFEEGNESSIKPETIIRGASACIGKLASRLYAYKLDSTDEGLVGYRALDLYRRTRLRTLGAAGLLDIIAPLDTLIGEYYPERVDESALSDPKSRIHHPLTWKEVLLHHAEAVAQSAKAQQE